MTDPGIRDLLSRMADELDHYRQLLSDDRREVHTLAAEARAALAAEPVGGVPTDDELLAMRSWSSHGHTFDSDLVDFARAVLARWGHPAAPDALADVLVIGCRPPAPEARVPRWRPR
jgi:hypothetical protein